MTRSLLLILLMCAVASGQEFIVLSDVGVAGALRGSADFDETVAFDQGSILELHFDGVSFALSGLFEYEQVLWISDLELADSAIELIPNVGIVASWDIPVRVETSTIEWSIRNQGFTGDSVDLRAIVINVPEPRDGIAGELFLILFGFRLKRRSVSRRTDDLVNRQ